MLRSLACAPPTVEIHILPRGTNPDQSSGWPARNVIASACLARRPARIIGSNANAYPPIACPFEALDRRSECPCYPPRLHHLGFRSIDVAPGFGTDTRLFISEMR